MRFQIPKIHRCLFVLAGLLFCVPPAMAFDDSQPAKDGKKGKAEKEKPAKKPPVSIFKDKALEAAVRAEVFAKLDNDQPIVKADVARISQISGRNKKIRDLSGLEHCEQVMQIDLTGNEITDLGPLKNLKRLQSLSLANNKITDLKPLADLVAIQLLDISANQVSDLEPIAKLTRMRTLYASDTQLTSLDPLRGLTKIWSLSLDGNGLTDLGPIAKLKWLTTLDVSRNQLTDLTPLQNLDDLDLLMLEKNKFQDFTPLIEMCQKDASQGRRFAPYLDVYLDGNPIDEKSLGEVTAKLEDCGVDVKKRKPATSK